MIIQVIKHGQKCVSVYNRMRVMWQIVTFLNRIGCIESLFKAFIFLRDRINTLHVHFSTHDSTERLLWTLRKDPYAQSQPF